LFSKQLSLKSLFKKSISISTYLPSANSQT